MSMLTYYCTLITRLGSHSAVLALASTRDLHVLCLHPFLP